MEERPEPETQKPGEPPQVTSITDGKQDKARGWREKADRDSCGGATRRNGDRTTKENFVAVTLRGRTW